MLELSCAILLLEVEKNERSTHYEQSKYSY